MKHISITDIGDSKNIPEGEIFAVHDIREKRSLFVLTPSTKPEEYWCLMVKIKGQLYNSDWHKEGEDKQEAKKAMHQILAIKRHGWFDTGEKRYDDMNLHKEQLYRCAYCSLETVTPDGPCVCRRIEAGLASAK